MINSTINEEFLSKYILHFNPVYSSVEINNYTIDNDYIMIDITYLIYDEYHRDNYTVNHNTLNNYIRKIRNLNISKLIYNE